MMHRLFIPSRQAFRTKNRDGQPSGGGYSRKRNYGRWLMVALLAAAAYSYYIIQPHATPSFVIAAATPPLWPIRSIDTMKYSRDEARNPSAHQKIPTMVRRASELGASHISVGTPYDDEFVPVLRLWVDAARKEGVSVWFRGNFSSWEGWFGYKKFADPNDHHAKLMAFIINNPLLFKDGDIFTPAPEPENGGLGDPRGSHERTVQFNAFLVKSHETCVAAFKQIRKNVSCGYFSTNGDVAKQSITRETVKKIGNVIVIDHYLKNPEQMGKDIVFLNTKLGAKVVVGEFGAPIPDIHGSMDQDAQAEHVRKLFVEFYNNRNIVAGLNYWVLAGGSTTLLNDDGTLRKAAQVIQNYYSPGVFQGTVENPLGSKLAGITVTSADGKSKSVTDSLGNFSVAIPVGMKTEIIVTAPKYIQKRIAIDMREREQYSMVVIEPDKPSILYKVQLLFHNLKS